MNYSFKPVCFLSNRKDDRKFQEYGLLLFTMCDMSLIFACPLCLGIGLCSQYGLEADQLAATWLGYAATHCHDEMTPEYLDTFERDQLTKKKTISHSGRLSRLNQCVSIVNIGL